MCVKLHFPTDRAPRSLAGDCKELIKIPFDG